MAYLVGEQVSADPALGRYWLELAAGHGSHEAEYQLSLQQVDREQQIHWLTRAANGGVAKALFELAELQHKQGELEQARASYAKAAQQDTLPRSTPTVKCCVWDKAAKKITHWLSRVSPSGPAG